MKVRLYRGLFPADLLVFSARGRAELTEVNFEFAIADATLKGRRGDGVDVRGAVTRSSSMNVLIHESRRLQPMNEERVYVAAVEPGEALVLTANWEVLNGASTPGRLCVVWTSTDRARARRPYLISGQDADAVHEYVRGGVQLPMDIANAYPRVRPLSGFELRSHRRLAERKLAVPETILSQPGVTSLTVRGLRGFRDDATVSLASPSGQLGSGLTFVVGGNNSGKSTLWESFEAVARKLRTDVSFSEGRRNRWTPDGVNLRLSRTDGSTYTVRSLGPMTSETEAFWTPHDAPHRQLEVVAVPSRRQFQAWFGKNANSQRDWMTVGSEYSRTQSRDGFSGRLFDLHSDASKKARFDLLMERVLGKPLAWTIDLGEGQHASYYIRVDPGDGASHTSEGLGDGIISLLFILNALYDSTPGTLLVLDEPELSLHPQLLRRLGEVISEHARDRQIVIFTHSPLLVSWEDLANGAQVARVYKEAGVSRIAQPERVTIDDLARVRNAWRTPHVLGVDANEVLFLDDGVIVVEGQEDAALLPGVFQQLSLPIGGTVYGWGAGGEGNIAKVLRLLSQLGFHRVAALLDDNVAETGHRLAAEFPNYYIGTIPAPDIRTKPKRDASPEVLGLLDVHGRQLRPELLTAARAALEPVVDYFSAE